jgi:hypothetical protein
MVTITATIEKFDAAGYLTRDHVCVLLGLETRHSGSMTKSTAAEAVTIPLHSLIPLICSIFRDRIKITGGGFSVYKLRVASNYPVPWNFASPQKMSK